MNERGILFQGAMVRALLAGTKTQTRREVRFTEAQRAQLRDPTLYLQRMYGTSPPPNPVEFGERGLWRIVGPDYPDGEDGNVRCPYGAPGDRLWVRETFFAFGRWETRFSEEKGRDEWYFVDMTLECGHTYEYAVGSPRTIAGAKGRGGATPTWWRRPAIFMPRAASRILLEVTAVRVQRLQDISEADAVAEGCITEKVVSDYDGSTIKVPAEIPHPSGIGAHGWDNARDWYADLWESINGDDSWEANPWVWAVEFQRVRP